MFRWLSQVGVVTWLNIRTIGQRLGASAATVVGVMGVVGVLVAVLSIAEGFRRTLVSAGSPDTALVLRSGSDSEMTSGLTRDVTRIIAEGPGVVRSAQGPIASAELYVVVDVPKRSTGTDANVPLRGVQPAAFQVRDEIKIVEGRNFEPGRNELIVGKAASNEFAGLKVGDKKRWGGNEWTVVGIFSANGALAESEIWCDVGVLQPAYRRGSTFQAVYAKLESPQAFDRFKDALTTDPRLDVKVIRESEYYEAQSRALNAIVRGLGMGIALVMAVGAIFGALNTMYSAVASRSREVATLRALGFGSGPVVISVLLESLALALLGGILGGAIAYAAFNGYQAATMNWSTFSQVSFAFAVTPPLLVSGIILALLIGLFGGLFPAIRAARMPVASALREL
ncbi:MAG TPA: ABC transporter permease [Thermoanaerobaculia bacterium]|jgi:putative ABC transport system permease protein|nr:ABC transporter permease [Thermoanaerobaculia bacterium]